MHEKLSKILTELRSYLETLYHERLVQIILYGSQARGDARPDSDIDVLIVLREPVDFAAEIERASYFLTELCLKYNVLVTCAFVESERFQHENGGFFRNVRREGIAV
ncbi:nucleotidyltransferase [Scytonema hofmannii PCC 7110]|uniref:Nucleotidyltransferase n=1 Tax=Scytonema hofmannii PCC 7110 TaxID=128403 RepID=A0A139XCH4_9CYAN|nr:nucleotidyltransferase domain-containing protein [Scytonema hofmannii]KYC42398.1 nucleotidyltransferase [Scytonema hofmannii PCC 7110]